MLTRSGVHAIRALTVLAKLPAGEYRGAAAVADAIGAPANYLGKLLHTLTRAGLLESQKGLGGGFRLAREAAEIRIHDVVDAIDGLSHFARCIFGDSHCSDENPCAVHEMWAPIRDDYLKMLRTTRVTDLLPSPTHRGVLRSFPALLTDEDDPRIKEA